MRKTLKRDLIAVIWTLLVTYAIGKWAFHLAYIERGYEAVGGEYLLIPGGGVTDRLEEVKQEEKLTRMVIVPVNAAGKVPEETLGDGKQKACDIYDNMTTYLWGTVKDALMMEEVSLENDNELVAQFTCRKYRLTSRGKMLLESKEEMKKRGIDSPDRADAVALSCYQKKTFNIGSLVD